MFAPTEQLGQNKNDWQSYRRTNACIRTNTHKLIFTIMKTSLFYGLLCSLLLFASCNTLDNNSNGDKAYEESWVIGSKTVINNDGLRNFWVKKNGNPVWERCSSTIENFDYEEGYEYLADIKVTTVTNPPQDGSSLKYSLLRIISKEPKESDVPILTNDLSKCFGSPELAFPELQF